MDSALIMTGVQIVQQVALESWMILQESVLYIFVGFIAAGLLKALLPGNVVQRHLGGRSIKGIFKASLLGIPLPL